MNNISEKYKCVYFSLETSKEKIYDRLMATTSGIRMGNIKTGNFDNFDKEKLLKGIEDVQNKNITVVSAAGYTVDKIRAKALKLKADIIFIDYLSLIKSEGKSRYEKTTNISLDLHTLAQEYGITVIVLSQLRRNNENEPSMEDLRESGQIEQDADLVFLLHDDKEHNCYWTIIAKNKEGKTGKIKNTFYKDIQKFMEVK